MKLQTAILWFFIVSTFVIATFLKVTDHYKNWASYKNWKIFPLYSDYNSTEEPDELIKIFSSSNGTANVTVLNEVFDDKYFRPLMSAFKLARSENLNNKTKTSFRSGLIPSFLLIARDRISGPVWQQQLLHLALGQCPLPCHFTEDKSRSNNVDAIVFFLGDIKNQTHMASGLGKRDPSQPWIMLAFEASLRTNFLYKTNYTEFNGVFNRTMMHRTDSDVFTPHGFIVKNEDIPYLPKDWVLPPPPERNYTKGKSLARKLVVSFISNCNAESRRLDYIREMQRYSQVDIFGKCGPLKCSSSRYVEHAYKISTEKCFEKAGLGYMFFLAFENAICRDYASEKLYNLLYYRLVPVVLGGADYPNILPPHSYINAAEYKPKELSNYLLYLRDHPEKYNEYLTWRNSYRPSTVSGILTLCHLCVKLYDSSFYSHKVYDNFYSWMYLESDCRRRWANSTSGIVHF